MDLGEFNGTNLVGPIRLVGSSRDIRIEQFTQSLELENPHGDIEFIPAACRSLPSKRARRSGRIELVLPEKAAFQLDATAERGEAVNDFGPQIRQESDGRSATLKGKVGNGPMLHIVSSRGAVSVRKEGSAPGDEFRHEFGQEHGRRSSTAKSLKKPKCSCGSITASEIQSGRALAGRSLLSTFSTITIGRRWARWRSRCAASSAFPTRNWAG